VKHVETLRASCRRRALIRPLHGRDRQPVFAAGPLAA